MLGEIIEVVTKLFEFSDRLQQAEVEKRQKIADYFRTIEKCLRESTEKLKKQEKPIYEWAKLTVYADSLTKHEVNELSKQSERLSELLNEATKNTTKNEDLQSITESLAGTFGGLAEVVNTNLVISNGEGKNPRKIPRKKFILMAAGSLGLTATAGWLAGQRTPYIQWKMATCFGENAKKLIIYNAPKMVCDRIREMTDGNFIIDLDTSGQIQTEQILENVNEGKIQCGYSGIYYTKELYRPLFFGGAIPFGLNPQEQSAWLYYKKQPNDELTFIQKIYEEIGLNVIPFPAGATGAQTGGWFNKEINSIADFNGLTMRIPGLGADILAEFGVKSDKKLLGQPIGIDQIANELATKTIQAAEWIGPYDDLQLGLHKVAKYYYYPGWWEPSTTFDVQVNKDAWKNLPSKYQEIFKTACFETYLAILTQYDLKNSEALQEIRQLEKSGKLKVLRFSDEILQTAAAKTKYLLDFYASGNNTFKEVYEEWKRFKAQIRDWSKLNQI
jgi:TRAP-type mannitol/chloroaromatic compound transport system substrate-binding protein